MVYTVTRSHRTEDPERIGWSSVSFYRGKRRGRAASPEQYRFTNQRQVERYGELCRMQEAGDIWGLQVHPRFVFRVNGHFIAHYTATFCYCPRLHYKQVVEDCSQRKGVKVSRMYRLSLRLMLAFYGIEVREV